MKVVMRLSKQRRTSNGEIEEGGAPRVLVVCLARDILRVELGSLYRISRQFL